jgi:thiamine biosynthesis lipoprotein
VLLAVLVIGAALPAPREREMRVVLGTFAEIEIAGAPDPKAAFALAFERIEAVERSLSIWKEESEVSRLNRAGEGSVSAELFTAIEGALELSRASGGAFDATLEPHGHERVELERSERRVRLNGTRLDLGAVLKGRAVDAALGALKESGAASALVDLGTSSIGVFGEEPVTFEVRNPKGGSSPASFRLREGAVASSSRDQLGAHILDPRTGEPASGVLAVTVVAKTAFEADALSTAVFVLGAREGLALLESRGAAGLVVAEEEGCLVLSSTNGFATEYGLETAEGVRIHP